MNLETIVSILLAISIMNFSSLILGSLLEKILNFFRKEPWNFATLFPKLAGGIFFPICFGIGLFLREKAITSKSPALDFLIYMGILGGVAGALYGALSLFF